MSAEIITQTVLARHFGVSQQYIAKLSKLGILDGCRKDGKLVRDCAIEAIMRYRSGNRVTRSVDVPGRVKKTTVYNKKNISELDELLEDVDDPNRRVQLMKDFWAAKINEYKAKEQKKELIKVEDVIDANRKIIKAYRDKTLSIPSKLSPVLFAASSQDEIRSILDDAVRELLEEVSSLDRLFD